MRQVLHSNRWQLEHFLARAKDEAGFSFAGKKVALAGLAFKQDTNDMRHSGAIHIIEHLMQKGAAEIKVFDPAAMSVCRTLFPASSGQDGSISYHDSSEAILADADCLFIATDWPEFRELGETISKLCQPPFLIMDGRRMIESQYSELANKGFTIIAVGSPLYGPHC